jgi:hypothetical protein
VPLSQPVEYGDARRVRVQFVRVRETIGWLFSGTAFIDEISVRLPSSRPICGKPREIRFELELSRAVDSNGRKLASTVKSGQGIALP